jgi:hypothetical protein
MATSTIDDTGNSTPNGRPTIDPGDVPPPPAPDPDAETWVLDAQTIRSTDQSEHQIVNQGDELYLARIVFRSTLGKANSTSAYFKGGVTMQNTMKNVHEGETHSIPDNMGKVSFPNVVRRSIVDVIGGTGPDLVGTVDVLFEDDNTPKGAVSDLMRDLANVLKDELAGIVESISLLNLDTDELAGELEQAMGNISDAITPTTSQAIGLFLRSFFNPDDLIGFRVNLFAAVDETLAPVVDAQVAGVFPASVGTAGALRARSYSHSYAGSAGAWVVSHVVSS